MIGVLLRMKDQNRAKQIEIGGLALASALLAFGFWSVREKEAFWPLFWPAWYGATAVMLAAFTLIPRSEILYRVSGGMLCVAWGSRIFAVYFNAQEQRGTLAGWYVLIGFVLYVLLLLYTWRFWFDSVLRWHRQRKEE